MNLAPKVVVLRRERENLVGEHLEFEDIERFARSSPEGAGTSLEEARSDEALHHLANCESCRGLVEMHKDFQQCLGEPGVTGVAGPARECPSETEWMGVVASQLSESRETVLLEHAAGCDACASILRQAVQDFTEGISEQELALLSSLRSAQPEWQQSLAQKLKVAHARQQEGSWASIGRWGRVLADRFASNPRTSTRHLWVYAAAAFVLLLGTTAWIVQKRNEPSIDQLVAEAYVQQRPFELRIAGAAYGPVRRQRGSDRSAFAEPASLLKAKYLIKERLASRPDDQTTLVASGRVELLEGHYDEAIRTFGRLLDAQPDSPPLLTDLATAYFERAEAGDRAIDYGQVIELLGRALAKTPDDPLILFNRAIALEQIYAYNEAIGDWEHYLRVDPNGDWAGEARQHLNELRDKMKARDGPAALLQSDPVAAASLLRARADAQSTPSLRWPVSLDEEYLDLAVRQWLASLYVSTDSTAAHTWRREPRVWDALIAAANVFRIHHKDLWLANLLVELPADSMPQVVMEPFVRALESLAQAAKANASGDADSAQILAESAAQSFLRAKSDAGYLRAREEIIYSMAREGRVQPCIQAADRQLHARNLDRYSWLHAQAILWFATCQGFAGNLGVAQQRSEEALEFTKNSGYPGQYLRSILFASGFLNSTERAWQDTRAGLQSFWEDWNNPIHAYESYLELAILAEEADQQHLTYHLWREGLGMIERTPDKSFQAVAHYNLAVAATRVENLPEAETEFKSANQQFAALSSTATGRLYRALAEIQWAAVAVQQGRLELASARLEQARPLLGTIPDTENAFRYYETLGELQFRRGALPAAERALRIAVYIAETELGSLRTDADRLGWERDTSPAYRTLVELYLRKSENANRALEIWESYLASPLRRPRLPSSGKRFDPQSLDTEPDPRFLLRIRTALPAFKHETVVSFVSLPSGVVAWAFDDRGVNFARIAASHEELGARVRDFAHLCADPYSDMAKLRSEARNLYDLLVAPFARELEPDRLLIVESDSILSDVPWPALVDPKGEYLGSDFSMVISPGLGYWLNLRPPAVFSRETAALVVGMPTLATAVVSRFAPLPDADREAREVASQFRHSHLLSGTAATSLAIQGELSHSEVFHFAGHAISSVRGSGLVLASLPNSDENAGEPRLLSASDLENAALHRLQLVVLSACATAETEKGFTGPNTLVRGFLRAGVPHVIASRWPVDSRTTQQTMTEFYNGLFQGRPTTKALQQAEDTLRRQPGTSHPYYWAAFGSYGR